MIQWVSYKMYLWWTRELVSQRPTALIFTDCNPSLVLQTTGGRCCTLRLTCLEWLNIRLTWTIAVFQPETFLCSTMELIISNQLHLVPQILSFSPTSSPFLGQTWTTSKKSYSKLSEMRIWQRHKSLWVNTGLFCVRESKGLVRSSNQLWESKEVFIQSCKKKLVESRSRWFRPDFTILISRPRTWKGILGLGDVCFSQIILFCVRQKKINDEKKCRSESPRSVITDNLESTWKKKVLLKLWWLRMYFPFLT